MALHKYIFDKRVSFIAYLFCLALPVHLLAGNGVWEFNDHEKEAYSHIISLQLSNATPLLKNDRPASLYLSSLSHTIKMIITEDYSLYDDYEDKTETRIEALEAIKSQSPYKDFYIAEIYLQKAFVNLKFGNEWSAAWDFRRAYKLMAQNKEQYPDFLPNYKSLGLLHVMIGSVPERHHWILNLLGMEGSVQQGLQEIHEIAVSNNIFRYEAQAIYHLLQAYLLNESDEAVTNFQQLYQGNLKNMLFGYLYASLLIKNSQSAKALQVLQRLQSFDDSYLKFNYLNYMSGEVYLQKGDYPLAETYFSTFLKNTRGRNFVKDAYYKLFLAYWLEGKESKALEAHKTAQQVGQTFVEADKHAARSLSQPEFPNKMIMKIRLFTDGGFYKEAEEVIAQSPPLNTKKEKTEFIYRQARLFHKTGDTTKAIGLYMETITDTDGENWYFAPNSCLQLGYIYGQMQDTLRATYYFRQVLDYKNHEYKASLDNKAKTALTNYEQ